MVAVTVAAWAVAVWLVTWGGSLARCRVWRELGAPPPGDAELGDGVGADLGHVAVAQLHVVREEHAVRAAGALVLRLQRGVAGAQAVLRQGLDLGAGRADVI